MSRDRRSSRSSTNGMSKQAQMAAFFRNHPKVLWVVYAVVVLLAFELMLLLLD